jgi:circadian clock protein KaiC
MTTSTEPRTGSRVQHRLAKAPTGIRGFDQITDGGLPRGRPTLVTGASGAGKTLFGIEFLMRGASEFGEPGVLMTFEERAADVVENVASLGFDLEQLEKDGLLVVDAVRADPGQIIAAGAFDLDGLFIRLAAAVEEVGAKRVVLDTIEVLFGALGNEAIVRSELGRLFEWLKERGLTAVVTGERGREGQLTRFGIEEYVSDCVIVLDHRVSEEISTRRLRVAKYRGSTHGTNEYPFILTERGFSVLPITALGLTYSATDERISTGVPTLDKMLGGGVYRGTSVLLSGSAGTGKTTLAAQIAEAACARGEQALFVSFEESPQQLVRNMASVGIDLGRWVEAGLLQMWSERASAFGLEHHLVRLEQLLDKSAPTVVVLDGLASLGHLGSATDVTSAVTREMDLVKSRGITGVITTLTHDKDLESSTLMVSSLVDTWLLVRNVESDGERNRLLFVIKSRGTEHSNQVREFVLTKGGAELVEVYVGPQGVVTGSARTSLQAGTLEAAARRAEDIERRRSELSRRSAEIEGQIRSLRAQIEDEAQALEREIAQESHDQDLLTAAKAALAGAREEGASDDGGAPPPNQDGKAASGRGGRR